jgi:hypothetical protein
MALALRQECRPIAIREGITSDGKRTALYGFRRTAVARDRFVAISRAESRIVDDYRATTVCVSDISATFT